MAMNVCVLFGGISPEHEVSLRSAESVLNHLNHEKYNIYPVGITKEGQWFYFPGTDYGMLPANTWREAPGVFLRCGDRGCSCGRIRLRNR